MLLGKDYLFPGIEVLKSKVVRFSVGIMSVIETESVIICEPIGKGYASKFSIVINDHQNLDVNEAWA